MVRIRHLLLAVLMGNSSISMSQPNSCDSLVNVRARLCSLNRDNFVSSNKDVQSAIETLTEFYETIFDDADEEHLRRVLSDCFEDNKVTGTYYAKTLIPVPDIKECQRSSVGNVVIAASSFAAVAARAMPLYFKSTEYVWHSESGHRVARSLTFEDYFELKRLERFPRPPLAAKLIKPMQVIWTIGPVLVAFSAGATLGRSLDELDLAMGEPVGKYRDKYISGPIANALQPAYNWWEGLPNDPTLREAHFKHMATQTILLIKSGLPCDRAYKFRRDN